MRQREYEHKLKQWETEGYKVSGLRDKFERIENERRERERREQQRRAEESRRELERKLEEKRIEQKQQEIQQLLRIVRSKALEHDKSDSYRSLNEKFGLAQYPRRIRNVDYDDDMDEFVVTIERENSDSGELQVREYRYRKTTSLFGGLDVYRLEI